MGGAAPLSAKKIDEDLSSFATVDRLVFASRCITTRGFGRHLQNMVEDQNAQASCSHLFLQLRNSWGGLGGAALPLFAKRGRKSERAASCSTLTDLFCNVSALRDSFFAVCPLFQEAQILDFKTFFTFQELPMLLYTTRVALQEPRTLYLQFPGFSKVVACQVSILWSLVAAFGRLEILPITPLQYFWFAQRTRGPADQGTRGPGDQRTRAPEDQGTRGQREDQGTREPGALGHT